MNFDLSKLGKTASVLFLALAMAGCGGGGTTTEPEPPPPDPIEVERDGIKMAIDAASAAVGMVTDASTDAEVMAADTAVAAAMAAINGATLIPASEVTSNRASLTTIQNNLASAKSSRTMAMNLASQRMAISGAIAAAMSAVGAVMDDSDDATVMAAQEAIDAATAAIDDATTILASEVATARMQVAGLQSDLDDAKDSRQMAMDEAERLRLAAEAREMARMKAEGAITAAMEAVAALSESSTDAEVTAAQGLIDAATMAAADAALDMAQMEGFNSRIDAIEQDFDDVGAARRVIEMAKTAAMNAATAADSAADAAEAAASAQEANKDADAASYALAKNAAERARAASDLAAAANTAAQAANTRSEVEAQRDIAQGHQATAETEQANAMKYAYMVAKAKSDADAEAEAMAARLAGNKVANTKKAAIATEADSTTTAARPFDLTAAPSDLTAPTADENYVLTVKHTGTEVEVTVLDGALPADNDPMYEQVATFGDGQMLVRNIGTDRKIIVVHSDIDEPDEIAFSMRYSLTVDRDDETTANDTYAVLADDNGKIESSRFPSVANTTTTYVVYDATTAAGRASQFAGTFDGASGLFRCVDSSDGCTVATDADGDFTALTASEWEFTPSAGATVDVPDADYMTYGFWLDTTTKGGEIDSYDTVQTFATSSLAEADSLSTVTGTAEYKGGAAGVYVHQTKNEDGTDHTVGSGRFTADVDLKAYFVVSTLRADNTIEGTISDFELSGGEENSWTVDVAASFSDAGALENGQASGMAGDNGSLSGQFHGPGDPNTVAPGVLVGEFNSNFTNGSVAGAYGARKE